MNVANLQTLLRNQAAFLADAGAAAKLVGDFRGIADGLEPFTALKFEELFVLLQQANEYRTTGILPVKAGKPKAAKADKSAAIAAAVQSLRDLFDRALEADFAVEDVATQLKSIAKLTVPQLKDVARGFEIANVPAKKADILAALGQRITDRREMHRRAQVQTPQAPG